MPGSRETDVGAAGPQALVNPYHAFVAPMEAVYERQILSDHFDREFCASFLDLAEEVYELTEPSGESFAFTDENLTLFKLPSREPTAERPNVGLIFECLACLDAGGDELEAFGAHTHRPTSIAPAGAPSRNADLVLGAEGVNRPPTAYELHMSLALVYEQVPRHYLPITTIAGVDADAHRPTEPDPNTKTDPKRPHPGWTIDEQLDRLEARLPDDRSVEELATTVTVEAATLTELLRISPMAHLVPTEIEREYAFSRPC